MTPDELFRAVMARLKGRIPTVEGQPDRTPQDVYRAVFPSPGSAGHERLSGGANRLDWSVLIVCVARTMSGLLDCVTDTRDRLTDWHPDPSRAASRLEERDIGQAAPVTDGPEGDRRKSLTLQYRMTTHRSTP